MTDIERCEALAAEMERAAEIDQIDRERPVTRHDAREWAERVRAYAQGAGSLLDHLADVLADVRAGVVPADGSVVRDALKRAAHHTNGASSAV